MQCHIELVEMWLRQAQPDNQLFVISIAQRVKIIFYNSIFVCAYLLHLSTTCAISDGSGE